MSSKQLRIGIIGADAKASWAGASHVPAITSQSGMVLAAIATRNEESARAASQTFGTEKWYADPYLLIEDPNIDVVTVAVRASAHHDLVLAALKAGKAVYCESPLGASLAETEALAEAAAGLHTAIGLQGRQNPSVRRAAEIIAAGGIGRIQSANVRATTVGFGPQSLSTHDYFNKSSSGSSFLAITTGHVLDIVEAVLGPISEVDARTQLLWPTIEIVDTNTTSVREIADHVDVIASTESGASFVAQVLAGVTSDPHFAFEVRGSDGWLKLEGHHLAGAQVGDLDLSSSMEFEAPDAPIASGVGPVAAEFWRGASINVGEVYASLARDLSTGEFRTPGFNHALHNSRLIDAVERAARTGQRQRIRV